MNDEPESGDDWTEDVKAGYESQESRISETYDGIMGSLPDWVPEPTQADFEKARNLVLDDWGYTPTEAIVWIDRYSSIGTENEERFYPVTHPNGRSLELTHFDNIIGKLAHYRWAANLAPEHGIFVLSGEHARKGYLRSISESNLQPRSVTSLTLLVEETFNRKFKHKEEPPTWREVLNALETYDSPTFPTIENIDWGEEEIQWNKSNGHLAYTSFGQLRNKLTILRKK